VLAEAHAALGHKLASHRAQAEALAAQGNLVGAVEQVSIGLRAGDGDFYELSVAEARRREWQELLASETSRKASESGKKK
jgi:predicted Zn-dependent protease